MDQKANQEWASYEVDALFAEMRNQTSGDTEEFRAKGVPIETTHQLSGQYVGISVEMLFDDIDGEPSKDVANIDVHDWSKALEGDMHASSLYPAVETTFTQPSKQLVVNAEGDQEAIEKPLCRSILKRRQAWTVDEHRQFLYGVKRFGRGEWKAISQYFVPSRTPTQLASHAQKYFRRLRQNQLYDNRKRFSINDVKLVNHNLYNTTPLGIGLGKVIPTASGIPPPTPIQDIDFLVDLAQIMPNPGHASNSSTNSTRHMVFNNNTPLDFLYDPAQVMPYFGQASNRATNLGRQMALYNGTLGRMSWEASSNTHAPREPVSVFLDQTRDIGAETRIHPYYKKTPGAAIYRRCKNNVGVHTTPNPPEILHFGHGGNITTNLASEMCQTTTHTI
ncbi:hypothetical protein ACP4OV_025255 [Aristida adscensionis]